MSIDKFKNKPRPKLIHTLFIRMDRIGDLVLSLPVDQSSLVQGQDCHWFISKGLDFVPQHASPLRSFDSFPTSSSWSQFKNFYRRIKELSPQQSVVFHAPWWVSLALWLARVPVRIGRLSQWHSFLFFNFGVRQKRSQALHHEFEYNLRLLKRGFLKAKLTYKMHDLTREEKKLFLKLSHPNSSEILETLGLEEKSYYVVHAGMAGSALNWPIEHYAELIKKLSETHIVVMTGTATDKKILEPLSQKISDNKNILWLNEIIKADELIAVLQKSKLVLAPSTGVIHLAASTGVPTLGIYSPILAEKSVRWGPRGNKSNSLTPILSGNFNKKTIMAKLKVEDVFLEIKQMESS